MNETELIRAAQSGDLESFNQLVLSYQDRIFNIALRILGDDELAADVVQDAFISAFRNIANVSDSSFKVWLIRVVVNKCYDELRRLKRHLRLSLEVETSDGDEVDSPPWLVDPGLTPEQKVEAHELTRTIQYGLNKLPIGFRAILVLADVQGLDYAEVAATLRIPIGTVRSRLARARLRLREHLRGTGELLPANFRKAPVRQLETPYRRW